LPVRDSGLWSLEAGCGSLAWFRIAAREEGVAMAGRRMLGCWGLRTDRPGPGDDMQAVTPGAAELQLSPMAWSARAGGSYAL